MLGFGFALLGLMTGAVSVVWVMSAAPAVEREHEDLETTVVYSSDGTRLAGFYEEDRIPLDIDEIPEEVVQAFIAVEDRAFYRHPGFDLRAVLRALYVNISHRAVVEGASTITQQLARNLYLSREPSLTRKLQEVRIALALERRHSKREILEMYLNHIYLGSGAYGVEAASQRYFDTPADKISLHQAAMLAGLPRSPNYYSPFL